MKQNLATLFLALALLAPARASQFIYFTTNSATGLLDTNDVILRAFSVAQNADGSMNSAGLPQRFHNPTGYLTNWLVMNNYQYTNPVMGSYVWVRSYDSGSNFNCSIYPPFSANPFVTLTMVNTNGGGGGNATNVFFLNSSNIVWDMVNSSNRASIAGVIPTNNLPLAQLGNGTPVAAGYGLTSTNSNGTNTLAIGSVVVTNYQSAATFGKLAFTNSASHSSAYFDLSGGNVSFTTNDLYLNTANTPDNVIVVGGGLLFGTNAQSALKPDGTAFILNGVLSVQPSYIGDDFDNTWTITTNGTISANLFNGNGGNLTNNGTISGNTNTLASLKNVATLISRNGGSGTTYTNTSGAAGVIAGSGIGTNVSLAQLPAGVVTNLALQDTNNFAHAGEIWSCMQSPGFWFVDEMMMAGDHWTNLTASINWWTTNGLMSVTTNQFTTYVLHDAGWDTSAGRTNGVLSPVSPYVTAGVPAMAAYDKMNGLVPVLGIYFYCGYKTPGADGMYTWTVGGGGPYAYTNANGGIPTNACNVMTLDTIDTDVSTFKSWGYNGISCNDMTPTYQQSVTLQSAVANACLRNWPFVFFAFDDCLDSFTLGKQDVCGDRTRPYHNVSCSDVYNGDGTIWGEIMDLLKVYPATKRASDGAYVAGDWESIALSASGKLQEQAMFHHPVGKYLYNPTVGYWGNTITANLYSSLTNGLTMSVLNDPLQSWPVMEGGFTTNPVAGCIYTTLANGQFALLLYNPGASSSNVVGVLPPSVVQQMYYLSNAWTGAAAGTIGPGVNITNTVTAGSVAIYVSYLPGLLTGNWSANSLYLGGNLTNNNTVVNGGVTANYAGFNSLGSGAQYGFDEQDAAGHHWGLYGHANKLALYYGGDQFTLDHSGNLWTAGTVTGNGSGVTNLNATNLIGTIPQATLPLAPVFSGLTVTGVGPYNLTGTIVSSGGANFNGAVDANYFLTVSGTSGSGIWDNGWYIGTNGQSNGSLIISNQSPAAVALSIGTNLVIAGNFAGATNIPFASLSDGMSVSNKIFQAITNWDTAQDSGYALATNGIMTNGTYLSGYFQGNGGGLTNLNVSGTANTIQTNSSGTVSAAIQLTNAANTFSGSSVKGGNLTVSGYTLNSAGGLSITTGGGSGVGIYAVISASSGINYPSNSAPATPAEGTAIFWNSNNTALYSLKVKGGVASTNYLFGL